MDIKAEYRARIDAMSAAERIERAQALFNWSRDYLARSIVATQGPMSEERLKWEIALRQYGAHAETRRLIDEMRERASR